MNTRSLVSAEKSRPSRHGPSILWLKQPGLNKLQSSISPQKKVTQEFACHPVMRPQQKQAGQGASPIGQKVELLASGSDQTASSSHDDHHLLCKLLCCTRRQAGPWDTNLRREYDYWILLKCWLKIAGLKKHELKLQVWTLSPQTQRLATDFQKTI